MVKKKKKIKDFREKSNRRVKRTEFRKKNHSWRCLEHVCVCVSPITPVVFTVKFKVCGRILSSPDT